MPDVDVLRELAASSDRPRFDDLVAVSGSDADAPCGSALSPASPPWSCGGRRPPPAWPMVGGHRSLPAPSPSQSETPTSIDGWTAEQDPRRGFARVTTSRIGSARRRPASTSELYCVGDQACAAWHPHDHRRKDRPLGAGGDAGRAVGAVRGPGRPWARYFDEDSILVAGRDRPVDALPACCTRTAPSVHAPSCVSDPIPASPGPTSCSSRTWTAVGTSRSDPKGRGSSRIWWTPAPAPSSRWPYRKRSGVGTERRRVPLGLERLPCHLAAAGRQLRPPRRGLPGRPG